MMVSVLQAQKEQDRIFYAPNEDIAVWKNEKGECLTTLDHI